MANTSWKKGRSFSFPVRDGFNNNINFRLECQLDKGNKRFVLRWQDPTYLNPKTGKKKSKTKSFKDYESAYNYVEDFKLKENLRNSTATKRVTFLSDAQLRDAEMAIASIPNGITLKQIAELFVSDLPNKEATINELYEEWKKEGERAGKRESSIKSRADRTREFRSSFGLKKAHTISFKDVEKSVFKKLKNGNQPSEQTIVNRWSGIRALINRGIQKGYVKKDGNPCEACNGFSDLPSPTPSKTFLKIDEARTLIKNATEYKDGMMLSYFSLACFSGLRPHEIHGGAFRSPIGADPLVWEDINLDSSTPEILVSEEKSKTRMTRWAPLQEYNLNLKILLHHARNLGHQLITIKNFKENWRAVARLSKLTFEGGDADKCRRSFATYLYNKEQTLADVELSKLMGNSPYVLKKHYKSVIKAGEGSKFFKIGPNGKSLTKNEIGKLKTDELIKKYKNVSFEARVKATPTGMLKYHNLNTGEITESEGLSLEDIENDIP